MGNEVVRGFLQVSCSKDTANTRNGTNVNYGTGADESGSKYILDKGDKRFGQLRQNILESPAYGTQLERTFNPQAMKNIDPIQSSLWLRELPVNATSPSRWFEVEAILDTAEVLPTIKWKYSPESGWAGYYVLNGECYLDHEVGTVDSSQFPKRLQEQLVLSGLQSTSCHILNLSEKADHKLQLCVPPGENAQSIAMTWLRLLRSTNVTMRKQAAWVEVPEHALTLYLVETPEVHGKERTYHVKVASVSWLGSDAGKTLRLEGQVHDATGAKVVDQQEFVLDKVAGRDFEQFVIAFTDVEPDTTFRFTLLVNDEPTAQATTTPAQLKYFYRTAPNSDRLTSKKTLPFTMLEGSAPAGSMPQLTIARIHPDFSDAKPSDLLAHAKALVQEFRTELDDKPMDQAGMELMRSSKKPINMLKYLIRAAVPGKYSNEAVKQHLQALELRTELYLKQLRSNLFEYRQFYQAKVEQVEPGKGRDPTFFYSLAPKMLTQCAQQAAHLIMFSSDDVPEGLRRTSPETETANKWAVRSLQQLCYISLFFDFFYNLYREDEKRVAGMEWLWQIQEMLLEHCERFISADSSEFEILQHVRTKIGFLRAVVNGLGAAGQLATSVLDGNDPGSFEPFLALTRARLVLSHLDSAVRTTFIGRGVINEFDPTLAESEELAFSTIRDALRVCPMSKLELGTSHNAKFHEAYSDTTTLEDTINDFHQNKKLGKLKQIKEHLFKKMKDADVPADADILEEGTEVLVFSGGVWLDGVVVDSEGDKCTFTTFYKSKKPPFKHQEVTREAEFDDIVVASDAEAYLEAIVLFSQVNFHIADLLFTKGDKKSAQQHAACALKTFRFSEPFSLRSHPAQYLRLLRLNSLCWAKLAKGKNNKEVTANLGLLVHQFQTELQFHVLEPFEIPHEGSGSVAVLIEHLKLLNNLFVTYMREQGEEESIFQLQWQPS